MIKIQNSGYPVVFQSDNMYTLPSTTGAVQWNGMNRQFEVSTGSGWVPINNTINLNTDAEYERLVTWARKKIHEEQELEKLAESDPTVKDLVDQIKVRQEQLKMVQILKKKETNESS